MFDISLTGKAPIYEQLYNGIAGLISSGRMSSGEKLPAVREVAKQLGINPNTVQKSYLLLEQAGLIYSIPAKGSYVSDEGNAAKALHEQALKRLTEDMETAKRAGVTAKEQKTLADKVWGSDISEEKGDKT